MRIQKRSSIISHSPVPPFRILAAVCLLIAAAGCGSSLKLKTALTHSPTDIPMYGTTAARQFTDTSSFAFPLSMAWEYDASAGFGNNSPVVVGSTLMMGTLQGELHAVEITTGKRIKYIKNFSPISSSAAVYQKYVIVGTESSADNLISFDTEDGDVRWTSSTGGTASSPLLAGDLLCVGGLDGQLYCFDVLYGKKRWTIDTKSPIRSSPCSADSLVFFANTKGEVFAANVNTGAHAWKYETGNAVFAGLTVAGGKLFVGSRDSLLHILDASTGAVHLKIPIGDKIMSTPAVQNGRVIVPSLNGSIASFNVSDGALRWKFQTKSAVNTTPVITPRAVFVASLDRHIYAVSPEDGTVLWKHDLETRIKTTPLLWNGSLIIAGEDKNIYCFR